jgi:hypothetical protein
MLLIQTLLSMLQGSNTMEQKRLDKCIVMGIPLFSKIFPFPPAILVVTLAKSWGVLQFCGVAPSKHIGLVSD